MAQKGENFMWKEICPESSKVIKTGAIIVRINSVQPGIIKSVEPYKPVKHEKKIIGKKNHAFSNDDRNFNR